MILWILGKLNIFFWGIARKWPPEYNFYMDFDRSPYIHRVMTRILAMLLSFTLHSLELFEELNRTMMVNSVSIYIKIAWEWWFFNKINDLMLSRFLRSSFWEWKVRLETWSWSSFSEPIPNRVRVFINWISMQMHSRIQYIHELSS
jgi:hypothetical protein